MKKRKQRTAVAVDRRIARTTKRRYGAHFYDEMCLKSNILCMSKPEKEYKASEVVKGQRRFARKRFSCNSVLLADREKAVNVLIIENTSCDNCGRSLNFGNIACQISNTKHGQTNKNYLCSKCCGERRRLSNAV